MEPFAIMRLPVDLLILIRGYLHHLVLSSFVENDDIEHFQLHEGRRSWRNFLSVSNCQSWKALRRETMIWTLNPFESANYLKGGSFKMYINERMLIPAQQLYLNLKRKHSKSFVKSSSSVTVDWLSNCNLMSLSVDSLHMNELPSNNWLKVLNIYNCERLTRLGDYPHLEHLQIRVCNRLSVIGEMINLEELKLYEFGKVALASFPLNNLTNLNITDSLVELIEALPRFHKLKELTIENGNFGNRRGRSLPRLPLPQLRSLTLETFNSVDLTGLVNLKYLNLQDVRVAVEVIDKENIYPQLQSFMYQQKPMNVNLETLSTFSNALLFANLRELSISLTDDSTDCNVSSVPEIFPVPGQLQCLALKASNYDLTRDSIWKKRTLYLAGCALNNVCCLSNVQSVSLVKCHQITDISPLASVPYLHLEKLSEVRDFSCFEIQRFLSIISCKGLKNPQLVNFGKIFELHLSDCPNITKLKNWKENRNKVLIVAYCEALTEIELKGEDYLKVTICLCNRLSKLNIEGQIYSLHLSNYRDVTITNRQNCVMDLGILRGN
jgi:hypothetical protein